MSPDTSLVPDLPPAPGEGTASWLRWAPLLLIAAAWLAHAGARQSTWVLDDARLVRDHELVAQGPAAIPRIFARSGTDDMVGRYGALTVSSFALEAPLWKQSDGTLSPGGFHLTNLLLHGLCVLLLFRVLLGAMPRRVVLAFAASVLFAVHPLASGTVTSLMGRSDLLAVLFALLTALAWRAWAGRHIAWLPVAAVAWLLALQASPVALGVPLVLYLLDRARRADDADADRHHGAPAGWARAAVLVFAVPLVVFLTTWSGVPPAGLDLPAQPVLERVGVGFEGLVRLVLAVVLPIGLRGDHSDEALPDTGYGVGTGAMIAIVVWALLTLFVLARRRTGVLPTSWLALSGLALPAFLVLPVGAPLELGFGYLVALPLFVAAGALAEALFAGRGAPVLSAGRGAPVSQGFALARGALVGALAIICLVGLTHREALGWRDDEAFHERLLDRNPQHVRAMVRLARAQRQSAEQLRSAAAQLPSDSPQRAAYLNLRLEALEKSAAWARRAVRHDLGRRSSEAWRELGFTLLAGDTTADALRALEMARNLDPVLRLPPAELLRTGSTARLRLAADTYYAIARCREALGEVGTSADGYLIAHQLDESNLVYLRKAGTSLCRDNRYAVGLRLLIEAKRRTVEPGARAELESIITKARRSARDIAARMISEGDAARQDKSDWRTAVARYEQATEVNPASARAWIWAGWARGHWFGDYVRADAHWKQAEALLTEGKVPKTNLDWRQLLDFRQRLAEQKADEDDEELGRRDHKKDEKK